MAVTRAASDVSSEREDDLSLQTTADSTTTAAEITLAEEVIKEGFTHLQMTKELFDGTDASLTYLLAVHETLACLTVAPTSPFLQIIYAPGIYSAMKSTTREVHDRALVFICGDPTKDTARLMIPMDKQQIIKESIEARVPSKEDIAAMSGEEIVERKEQYDKKR